METAIENKTCQNCGKVMRGRSDKKFCNDYCRNHYNNHLRGADNNYIRNVNGILRRNRRILQQLLPPGKSSVKTGREQLLLNGFHFGYHTHVQVLKKGNSCFYCYEYGYSPTGEQVYTILKRS